MLPAEPIVPAAARLLIHADSAGGADEGALETVLVRLQAILAAGTRQARRVPLRLSVEDLQGRRVLAVDDAGPLLEVPLPAGTYRVNADAGTVRRSYTMTLEPGASFDLHLRLGLRAK